ncbi:MAG: hypothetical protein AAGC70_03680 [Pseudomonadota bacterium]
MFRAYLITACANQLAVDRDAKQTPVGLLTGAELTSDPVASDPPPLAMREQRRIEAKI